MASTTVKEVYVSPSGDKWVLARNGDGELVVGHYPNRACGGGPSEIAVDVYLLHGGQGPERQALTGALAELELSKNSPDDGRPEPKALDEVQRVLGKAVVRCWSKFD